MMLNKRLINLVPSSRKYVFFTVALKLLALISNSAMILLAAEIFNSFRQGLKIWPEMILIALCLAVTFLANHFSTVTSFKTSSQVKKTMRSLLYEKLLRMGPDYQEKFPTAKLLQLSCEGVEQIEIWFGQYLPQFFYSMIASLVSFIILALFVDLKMAVILLICFPLIPMSIVAVQKIAKKILKKYLDQYEALSDNYLENLQGLTTLELYQADEYKQKQIGKEAENFRRVTMKVLSFQLNSTIVMDVVAYAGSAIGIAAAAMAYWQGGLSLERCFAGILIAADFFIPLRRLGSYFHTAMNGNTASNSIFEILDTEEIPSGNENFPEKKTKVLFEADKLSYNYGERCVLSPCSLTIDSSSFTAFTGKSGSGKSTLAKIIAGINCNYKGSAKIYGREISQIKRVELFKKISYISHKDWIFKGSVKDCLLEGNPDADEKRMWSVLKAVKLDGFVKEMGGLDFQILENASNLSGGQKQRLSIARALIHDSEIYIFDEASSNIDVESEQAILDLLHKLKSRKTVIMISHRKDNSLGADKIFDFKNGVIRGGKK